jgi:hypothetical protein
MSRLLGGLAFVTESVVEARFARIRWRSLRASN